jgi:hypothetical protein
MASRRCGLLVCEKAEEVRRIHGMTIWAMLRGFVAFALVAVLAGSGGAMASAEVFNCGNPCNSGKHCFDGKYDLTTANRLGAAATISERFGAVCDTDTSNGNTLSTWAMIAPANGRGWAQSGYLRWYNHCNVVFAQDSADGVFVADMFTGMTCQQDGGQLNTFTEQYDGSCSCIHQDEGGRILESTSFDPTQNWSTPWSPEFFGEAVYKASDMPGNSTGAEQFTALKYQDSSGFHNYPCAVLSIRNDGSAKRSDGEAWFNKTPTCPNLNIYTDTSP